MSSHRKRPRDPNQLGKFIVDIATGEVEDRPPTPPLMKRGRQGGLKGGPARTESLGVTSRLWEFGDVVDMLDAWEVAHRRDAA